MENLKNKPAARLDPVFIIGYSRSGTTLLSLMLNAHPALFIPKESEYFQRIPRAYRNRRHKTKDVEEIIDTVNSKLSRNSFRVNKKLLRTLLSNSLPGKNNVLIACLYQAWMEECGKSDSRWGDKKPQHWAFVYNLKKWYPNSQFIHIVRDPRDVVASIETSFPQRVPLRKIIPPQIVSAWHWRKEVRTIKKEGLLLGSRRYFMIQYENLVSKTHSQLENICNFLGINFTDDMLKYQKNALSSTIHTETQKQPHTKKIGRYDSYLSKNQVNDIEYICKNEMKDLGYQNISQDLSYPKRIVNEIYCFILDAGWFLLRITRRVKGSL